MGNLVARQHAGSVLRYALGVPLMLFGAVTLFGAFSSLVIPLREEGMDALPGAIIGSFLMLVLTAFTLPLGWWLTLGSHWIVLENGTREIVESSDWKIARKEKRTPVNAFRSVRIALEPLNSAPSARGQLCQKIRLISKRPASQHSIEVGSLDKGEREQAIVYGQQVAEFLKLGIEITDADALS